MGALGIAIGLATWLAIAAGHPEHVWVLVAIVGVGVLAWWLRPD
jgi:hypothetical protein